MPSKDKKALMDLQKTKNRFEFLGDVNEKEIPSEILRVTGVIIAFVAYYNVELDFTNAEKDLIEKIEEQHSRLYNLLEKN